jgi:Uma2 family endonuclease
MSGLPAIITLDHLAALNTVDEHGHRYELSPDGALSVMPLPDSEHAAIAGRIMVWLILAGWRGRQLLQAAGIRILGAKADGGRIPDLTVWSRPQSPSVWLPLDDLVLLVEIVSPSSKTMDSVQKVAEYAAAGVARYWVVDRDTAQTVTQYVLGEKREYEAVTKMPLAWLLRTAPAEHGLTP